MFINPFIPFQIHWRWEVVLPVTDSAFPDKLSAISGRNFRSFVDIPTERWGGIKHKTIYSNHYLGTTACLDRELVIYLGTRWPHDDRASCMNFRVIFLHALLSHCHYWSEWMAAEWMEVGICNNYSLLVVRPEFQNESFFTHRLPRIELISTASNSLFIFSSLKVVLPMKEATSETTRPVYIFR